MFSLRKERLLPGVALISAPLSLAFKVTIECQPNADNYDHQ
jgi:hypothetical protein